MIDHKKLFDALKLIDDKNFRVDLVGGGELLEENIKYAEKLNILDKVNFLGELSNVSQLLSFYDCGILISKMEGLPVSIIEYMKSGLLVISSDVGGCNELVKNNLNGFLINNNPAEISSSIKKIICKKCDISNMKNESKKLFNQTFSKEIFFNKLEENLIYKNWFCYVSNLFWNTKQLIKFEIKKYTKNEKNGFNKIRGWTIKTN